MLELLARFKGLLELLASISGMPELLVRSIGLLELLAAFSCMSELLAPWEVSVMDRILTSGVSLLPSVYVLPHAQVAGLVSP
jgi:hypothetical protein